jgi:hypothetical protein
MLAAATQQLYPCCPPEIDIHDRKIDRIVGQVRFALFGANESLALVPLGGQYRLEKNARCQIIIDNDYAQPWLTHFATKISAVWVPMLAPSFVQDPLWAVLNHSSTTGLTELLFQIQHSGNGDILMVSCCDRYQYRYRGRGQPPQTISLSSTSTPPELKNGLQTMMVPECMNSNPPTHLSVFCSRAAPGNSESSIWKDASVQSGTLWQVERGFYLRTCNRVISY